MSWTIKTLKKYFESKLKAMHLAITKAEEATKIHFENVNRWRDQLDKQETELARKTELTNLEKRVDEIKESVEKLKNLKQGGYNAWVILVAGAGILIAFLMFVAKLLLK